MIALPAYLTPAVGEKAAGTVHSVFDHAVNVRLDTLTGPRLVTLISRRYSRVPDSILMPEGVFRTFDTGDPCVLDQDMILIGRRQLTVARVDDLSRFRIKKGFSRDGIDALLEFTSVGSTGLDGLPPERREQAVSALGAKNGADFIGLGPGLTPSYDDACVGVMAVFAAADRDAPFMITDDDLAGTTFVSARYLRLAREGYFGEAIVRVLEAVGTGRDVRRRALELEWIGATSGRDILFGMRQALLALERMGALPER